MARPTRRTTLYTAAPSAGISAGETTRSPDGRLSSGSGLEPSGASVAASSASSASKTSSRRNRGPEPWSHARADAKSLALRWAFVAGAMLLATLMLLSPWRKYVPQRLTQADIDAAVLHTLDTKPLPAPAAKAYEAVIGSVVRVVGMRDDRERGLPNANDIRPPGPRREGSSGKDPSPRGEDDDLDDDKHSVGSGVVIIDNGTILTNLHVVAGAKRVKVEFADGLVSEADLLGLRPEHDLAVLRARRIPDDLKAATMRSTGDLRPGDRVTAVGFPFGIGPSVSHGVVSGLKRDFRSPDGKSVLSNLIQFDAAANPGNSGGPLVTDGGEVVGIVTAIYNPTAGRFFVGLGFAVPIENAAQAAGMPPF